MLYIMNLILYFNLYHLASAIACLAKFHAGTFRTCPHGLSGYLLHGCRWRATSAHIPLSLHHWRQVSSRDGWRLIDTKVQAPHILFFWTGAPTFSEFLQEYNTFSGLAISAITSVQPWRQLFQQTYQWTDMF